MQAFVLVVTLTFEAQAKKDRLIQLFRPAAEYVADNEPNTLSFEMSASEDEPLTLMLYERSA